MNDQTQTVEQIARQIDRPLQLSNHRLDVGRATRMFVTTSVYKHVHITLGDNEAVIIMHPHAARRMIAAIEAILDGKDFDRG